MNDRENHTSFRRRLHELTGLAERNSIFLLVAFVTFVYFYSEAWLPPWTWIAAIVSFGSLGIALKRRLNRTECDADDELKDLICQIDAEIRFRRFIPLYRFVPMFATLTVYAIVAISCEAGYLGGVEPVHSKPSLFLLTFVILCVIGIPFFFLSFAYVIGWLESLKRLRVLRNEVVQTYTR